MRQNWTPGQGQRLPHQMRYLVVAGATALLYVGTLTATLAAGLHYMLAIVLSLAVHFGTAFPAHRRYVFASRGTLGTDLARFFSVWSTAAVAGLLGTPILVEVVGLPPLMAQAVAIVVVAGGSYLGHRFFSFRHPSTDASDHAPEG